MGLIMAVGRKFEKLKMFVSYSRQDFAAADAIVDALTARDFEVKIDTRDLPFGEKWQAELAEFIRLSDTVIWLVSEPSIRSDWVNWELDQVARRSKRLVPLMVGLVKPDELPRQLGEIQILPRDRLFDLTRDLDTLIQVLKTDGAWLKQAGRLQDRAAEWLAKSRTPALLLSSGALADAEDWKQKRPEKAPALRRRC
ncbi:MAG: toll/interleukin-1 receptor domain-containing protein [Sphingomonadales bacterium]|nr:toll/interleukin-1 receptor domain-containing protein [Sphingomonadales bacterium]